MRGTFSRVVLVATTTVGLGNIQPAIAQEAAVVETGEQDIIVSARRRDERLLDVPIAVTSISGAELEQRGALDLTDVAKITPNVVLEPVRGTSSTLSAFIRGIGQNDPIAGLEGGVGIYLDDVYLNRPQGSLLDIFDVERIEVLRGPQGTLYGRNTIGGAIKYVTKRLPTDFSLRLKGTLGTHQQADGVITISAPINSLVRVGGAFARLSNGGFGKNLTTGKDNYNKDIWAGRGTLEIGGDGEPGLIRISGDYTRDNSNTRGGHRLIAGLASGTPVLPNVYDTQGGLILPDAYVKAYGLSMTASATLSDTFTLRSISAWRRDRSSAPFDLDALAIVDADISNVYFNEQTSQEVQLLVSSAHLNGLVGVYYLGATADNIFDTRLFTLPPPTPAGFSSFQKSRIKTATYAVFADFTYDFLERLSLSVGGRFTSDKRSFKTFRQNYRGGGAPYFGGTGVPLGGPTSLFDGSRTFKNFSPRASLSFKPTPDQNIYASYSQGFKGGGFDPRGVADNAPDLDRNGVRDISEKAAFLSFRPEKVKSYEVGYKGSLFNDALYVAATGFYADYTDVQIPGAIACQVSGQPAGVLSFCGLTTNAGKAVYKGVELETTARLGSDLAMPGDRLSVSGTMGYIDAKFKKFVALIAGAPLDVAAFRNVKQTPKWTASGTVNYTTPVGDGTVAFGTTLAYRSKVFQGEIPDVFTDNLGSYTLLSANLTYTAPNDRWSIGIYGKNLTDTRYITGKNTFFVQNPITGAPILDAQGRPRGALGTEGPFQAYYGNPRQVFVTGTVSF